MNLYLITREGYASWDEYQGAVVAAVDEHQARWTHPSEYRNSNVKPWDGQGDSDWINAEDVRVKLIGKAVESTEAGVICSDFHAG